MFHCNRPIVAEPLHEQGASFGVNLSPAIDRKSTDRTREPTDRRDCNEQEDEKHEEDDQGDHDGDNAADARTTGNGAGNGCRGQDLEVADCDLTSGDTNTRSRWVKLLASNPEGCQ